MSSRTMSLLHKHYFRYKEKVLFLRQVDDFAVACEDKDIAEKVIQSIESKITIKLKILIY